MKSLKLPRLALAVVMAGMMLAFSSPSRAADAPPPPLKVAICNPLSVITTIQEYKDLKDAANKENDKLKADAANYQQQLTQMQNQLAVMVPNTQQYNDMSAKFEQTTIQDETDIRIRTATQQRKYRDETVALFKKMNDTIMKISKDQGITLVLPDHHVTPDELDKINDTQTLNAALLQQTILYNDASMDITQKVILQMDTDYKNPAPAH